MRRRKFIKTICVASAIGTSVLSGCKSTQVLVQGMRKDNDIYVPLAEFDLKKTINVAYENSAIGVTQLEDDNYVAVLLKCTHMGCAVASEKINDTQAGFVCPCHGAKFAADGEVLKGPAEKNLTQFSTSIYTSTAGSTFSENNGSQFVVIHL